MDNSKKTYDVSVIIPTYNRSKLLSYTLYSLVNQNLDKNRFEVIIGDDGSSDDTRDMVAAYAKLMNVKYTFQEDLGYRPASARNKAIRCAEGKVCVFVDSSVILAPDCLSEHIAFHARQQSPKAAIGYVYGFDHNEASEDLLIKLVEPADPVASLKRLAQYEIFHDVREDHYIKHHNKIENLPAPWFYFWTCHLSVATKELLEVGLFDESYDGRWGVEDNDLGFRLHQNGVDICLLRSARAIHYPHGKDKAGKQEEGYENCVFFHKKFNTPETKLFLKHYRELSLVDINELSLKASAKMTTLQQSVG